MLLRDLLRSIEKAQIKNLIIDLRNNLGGEDSYYMYLLKYLLADKFAIHGEVTFRENDYTFLPDGKHYDIAPECFKKNTKGTYDATEHLWEDLSKMWANKEGLEVVWRGGSSGRAMVSEQFYTLQRSGMFPRWGSGVKLVPNETTWTAFYIKPCVAPRRAAKYSYGQPQVGGSFKMPIEIL